jgi:anti-sigma factor RsiW
MTTEHLPSETLTDYIHGELPPEEDARAYAHLLTCERCRFELEEETTLTERLRLAASEERFALPARVKATVRQATRDARGTPFAPLLRFAALPVAAAILIGTLVYGPLLHTTAPTIDAVFYLDAHAAQQAANPLAEHNLIPTEVTYDTSAGAASRAAQIDAVDVVR